MWLRARMAAAGEPGAAARDDRVARGTAGAARFRCAGVRELPRRERAKTSRTGIQLGEALRGAAELGERAVVYPPGVTRGCRGCIFALHTDANQRANESL